MADDNLSVSGSNRVGDAEAPAAQPAKGDANTGTSIWDAPAAVWDRVTGEVSRASDSESKNRHLIGAIYEKGTPFVEHLGPHAAQIYRLAGTAANAVVTFHKGFVGAGFGVVKAAGDLVTRPVTTAKAVAEAVSGSAGHPRRSPGRSLGQS
jgi:hypothetical protein